MQLTNRPLTISKWEFHGGGAASAVPELLVVI